MTGTWWIVFNVFVLLILALDLGVFHRKAHEVKTKEALVWTGVWVTLALIFCLLIYLGVVGGYDPVHRGEAALTFLTGYLVEQSLSVDNIFVIALIFKYFRIPAMYQHRVLFWGILGALVMRAIMIVAGVALINQFHWIIYLFGGILIYSAIKMWRSEEQHLEIEHNPVLKLVRKFFPVSPSLEGQNFFTRLPTGVKAATPLFVVLVFVEWTDLVFAVDSIPAILAISKDTFIVYTSNVMAILGLRSMYFALSGILHKFHLLHYGLAIILGFVGTKMVLADVIKIDTRISLAVIFAVLATSVIASLKWPKKEVEVPEEKADDVTAPPAA
ncbi:TerC family protein [Roseimicrobium sp. ORNL1]|uniref:TerC family protein n=1 Tax=Roseimicrobium sp. ORNL1 TaxID=2711231 RepID=UPI0013E16058|nr:TerC family protein [Roseimicrobium sp. ORNL1]QIF02678.1 TerC family protein [Roseimicrobium sp. ORNL1]